MIRFIALFWIFLCGAVAPAGAVGFQWASAPDPEGTPLQVAIWYPSDAQLVWKQIGPFEMNVAMNAAVSGRERRLIVISHGTGGMALSSWDTAMALAEAGFVVAAVTHAGDNYQDHALSFSARNFSGRSHQIARVIDFMLTAWDSRAAIDPAHIGFLGHSAGGATGLLLAGGVGDWRLLVAFCQAHPQDWGCRQAREKPQQDPPPAAPEIVGKDERIRAFVLAAPALAHMFAPHGLVGVTAPVQLWVGGADAIVLNAALVRSLLPRPPDYHAIPHVGHFAYLAPCNDILRRAAPEICADPPGFNRARFLVSFQRSIVAFYRKALK